MLSWNKKYLKHLNIGSYEIAALAIIALAVLLRIFLIVKGWPETDSDEGTMGLEAMHIAFRGEHPIFLYGQNYMGMIEAFVGALLACTYSGSRAGAPQEVASHGLWGLGTYCRARPVEPFTCLSIYSDGRADPGDILLA